MVRLSALIANAALACSVMAFPLTKRISETIDDSMVRWKPACFAANGGDRCNDFAVRGFTTLLAAAKPCDQQDAADNMIDLAKSLNSQDMIRFTQIFVQQPRNTVCRSPAILVARTFIDHVHHVHSQNLSPCNIANLLLVIESCKAYINVNSRVLIRRSLSVTFLLVATAPYPSEWRCH